jgi:hypothetical protein
VLGEVGGDTGEEGVDPDPGHELLEHRSALGVGDAVEVHLHGLEILDGGNDGMRRRQLVLAVGPALLHGLEGGPRLGPLGGLGRRDGGRPLREGLVEPEVVPPLHGDEIAEPHVGELVQDRDDTTLLDGVGHLRAEDVGLGEGDRTRVLHRAGVELRHEELVVLGEGVGVLELLFVVREALAGLLEDVVGVEILAERLAREQAERDDASAAVGQFGAHDLVGAGDECGHIGGEDRGRLEGPGRGLAVDDGFGGGRIAHELPGGGRGHGESERRLEVGLLEDGEDAPGVRHLELGVQVDLVVDRVDEAVQSLAGVRVLRVRDDGEGVLGLEAVQLNPDAVAHRSGVELGAVESDGVHRARDRVDEGR